MSTKTLLPFLTNCEIVGTAPIAGEGPLPELVPEFHLLSVPAENLVPAEDDE